MPIDAGAYSGGKHLLRQRIGLTHATVLSAANQPNSIVTRTKDKTAKNARNGLEMANMATETRRNGTSPVPGQKRAPVG